MGRPAEASDQELVELARKGDLDAFDLLIRRFHRRVAGLCASLLDDPAAVDDAAQEVFVKAYRGLKSFQGGSKFSTWLYRVTSNHCLDLKRKAARRKTDSLDAILEVQGVAAGRLFREPASHERSLEEKDLAARLLAALPRDYREILLLRETQGLSYQDIAASLGCTLDAVKARLRRARRLLKEKLGHFAPLEDVSPKGERGEAL